MANTRAGPQPDVLVFVVSLAVGLYITVLDFVFSQAVKLLAGGA